MSSLKKRFPIYSKLLRLYPPAYQKKYSQQMLQTLADMLDDGETYRGVVWLRTVVDLPLSLVKQNAINLGETMAHDTPTYVKWSSALGILLLLPFFTLIIVGSLVRGHLFHSWFWHYPVIFTWLIFLPSVAIVISLLAYLKWYVDQKQQRKTTFWRYVFDWRHTWPLLMVGVLAFGIIALAYGHDSVHCVTGNPVREARNWQQTWRCIRQS